MSVRLYLFTCLCCLLFSNCATWYQRTAAFQSAVSQGEFEQAEKLLRKDKKQARHKNQILYYLNLGYVQFMLGDPEASNEAFEKAERLTEDQQRNAVAEAAVLVSNPEVRPYRPEDFEVVMINVYKALNYLQMNDLEGALVEARKIDIRLHQLNDKYPKHKNRYSRDAFAQLLSGLIYDASGDANNAFIAYRNAYETYQSDYVKNFLLPAPEQLKKDLLRTAYQCGFTEELSQYEKTFGIKYTPAPAPANGQVVLFWMNGFGPVKSEWGINFTKVDQGGGALAFHNAQLGLTIPVIWNNSYHENEHQSLADVDIVRIVFPKYVERVPAFTKGQIKYDQKSISLETAEDLNQIAFKTLHDRMVREVSNSILRVAVKQGIQHAASKKNEWLGFAVGLANAFTEKADTRNWQTLPYSISYARVPLSATDHQAELLFTGKPGVCESQTLKLPEADKRTHFMVYSTL